MTIEKTDETVLAIAALEQNWCFDERRDDQSFFSLEEPVDMLREALRGYVVICDIEGYEEAACLIETRGTMIFIGDESEITWDTDCYDVMCYPAPNLAISGYHKNTPVDEIVDKFAVIGSKPLYAALEWCINSMAIIAVEIAQPNDNQFPWYSLFQDKFETAGRQSYYPKYRDSVYDWSLTVINNPELMKKEKEILGPIYVTPLGVRGAFIVDTGIVQYRFRRQAIAYYFPERQTPVITVSTVSGLNVQIRLKDTEQRDIALHELDQFMSQLG